MEILQGVSVYIFLAIFGGLIDLFENNDRQRAPLFYSGSITAAQPVGAGAGPGVILGENLVQDGDAVSHPCNVLTLQEQKLIER
ncbi:MAG: hypothetical protein ACRCYK_18900 [Aeromonas hydrophila]